MVYVLAQYHGELEQKCLEYFPSASVSVCASLCVPVCVYAINGGQSYSPNPPVAYFTGPKKTQEKKYQELNKDKQLSPPEKPLSVISLF